jgi:hypothetical protein
MSKKYLCSVADPHFQGRKISPSSSRRGSYFQQQQQEQKIECIPPSDPVFTKRQRQFHLARACEQAPVFDPADCRMPKLVPKLVVVKTQKSPTARSNS